MEGVSVKRGTAILDERGIDRQHVQQQLFDCMLEQIFMNGIFHADPHPGNVYILNDGTPALLDFGSVGRLGTLQRDALKRLLIGFEQRKRVCDHGCSAATGRAATGNRKRRFGTSAQSATGSDGI
ncbi:AarF/UbiB family protein [Cohnella soli]|uniref:AarF/UbiB family protein n=1 Tax=Cohnella soli TaxID=425005 RepID=A0ABW0HYT3_9BACL